LQIVSRRKNEKEFIRNIVLWNFIIRFKECLRNNIMPFIVLDDDKPFYMRGLKEYENDKMFLIDTIKQEQDLYKKICEELLDFKINEN